MKKFRLNRLFDERSGKCLNVAIDHGIFNEYGFLKGIENLRVVVERIADAKPDAIQLSVGQAHYLQSIAKRCKPALVLRVDVANIYGSNKPTYAFDRTVDKAVEQALVFDAACIVANLLDVPGHAELSEQCIANIVHLRAECERFGMPLMVEPLAFKGNLQEKGGYVADRGLEKIMALVRQAVELGADIVKADPTEEPTDYFKVVEVAGEVPVLVRGGGRVSDREILERTKALIEQGASGIVYGRNIIQHRSPQAMTQALAKVVHGSWSVRQALVWLESEVATSV